MFKVRLFCLPYAGASAVMFYRWREYLSKFVELCPLELAGRGARHEEPFYHSIDEAVDDVLNMIQSKINHLPYAIFGHSLGSLLAYESCIKIQQLKLKGPVHIFFSGELPPNLINLSKSNVLNLSDKEFLNMVIEFGGISDEFLKHKELTSLFMPVLKSDYYLVQTYNYKERGIKLDCDITVLNGNDELILQGEYYGWQNHTNRSCKECFFDGGHFFINENMGSVVEVINEQLKIFK
jgi:surfactin synthase thioesterase subunit